MSKIHCKSSNFSMDWGHIPDRKKWKGEFYKHIGYRGGSQRKEFTSDSNFLSFFPFAMNPPLILLSFCLFRFQVHLPTLYQHTRGQRSCYSSWARSRYQGFTQHCSPQALGKLPTNLTQVTLGLWAQDKPKYTPARQN